MVATVQISHDYPYTAAQVWDVATDLDHLRTVTKGLLEFRDLPNGQIFEGQHIKVQVSLFGKLPFQPYEMTVALLDHSKMTFQSHEIGAGVKFWRHTLRVCSNDMGCRVEETIEINAGILTPIFAV